ncbi:protein kinase C and casein kinase substrate in neurons protein 2-like [Oopsacas minuta]|uniref:Protein kinase C and casein kinase substrate in neurons protein 2-like n=1 Tax=Oopsacas minuta TaxID=111878 RepID=A0AAV7JC83_9METZ|nr:protein kinase C and casein kinase substrate in neurons protein 2-like [Oopsacas minuta]
MECKVLFDYKAGEEDELDLKMGDVVTEVISGGDLEDGWWSGMLNGQRGVFPNNFVAAMTPTHSNPSPPSNNVGHSAPKYAPTQSDPALRTGINKTQRAKVTFSYKPVNPDELKLEVGDIVEIFNQVEDGWLSGSHKGSRGVFPSNFVEFIEETPADAPTQTARDVKNKVPVGGIALPIIPIQGGKPSEKKLSNQIERAKVAFSYEPQEEDELKLEIGDIVDILNKEHAEGWWEGRLNGKTGVFPNNFVELIPEAALKSVPQKPLLKPSQAPRTEPEIEPSIPRKPSLKGAPAPTPKRSGPTNELQRKLDRRNKLNVGPDPMVPPTDNGQIPAPVQAPRAIQEDPVTQEEQKAPVRRASHDQARPSVPKAPENVEILARSIDPSEFDQLRAEMSDLKKEFYKLKQEYREDFDRLVEEGIDDKKMIAELKIEVDSLKKRRAEFWIPEKKI